MNYTFNIGDKVRIVNKKKLFRKGYESGWSEEIFKVTSRLPRHPPVYGLSDLMNEKLSGTFYAKELQKVDADQDLFIVEKVLKTRRRKGHPKEYFVQWRGWPEKFNSWVTDIYNV